MSDYATSFKIRTHVRYFERQVSFFRSLITIERFVILIGAGSAVFAIKKAIPEDIGFIFSLVAGTYALLLAALKVEERLEEHTEQLVQWKRAKKISDRLLAANQSFSTDVADAISEAEEGAGPPLRNLLLLAENDILTADDHDRRFKVGFWEEVFAPIFDLHSGRPVEAYEVHPVWRDAPKVVE